MAHTARSAPHPARGSAPIVRRTVPARTGDRPVRHGAVDEAARDAAAGTAPAAWWWRLAEALAPPLAEGQAPQRGLWVV
jgi:hypothetical protein